MKFINATRSYPKLITISQIKNVAVSTHLQVAIFRLIYKLFYNKEIVIKNPNYQKYVIFKYLIFYFYLNREREHMKPAISEQRIHLFYINSI